MRQIYTNIFTSYHEFGIYLPTRMETVVEERKMPFVYDGKSVHRKYL
jgi:hypothetical protein